MSIYESFCYNGTAFQLVFGDTIGFIQGGTLYLWDLATGKKDYILSQKNGFQSFVAHPKKGIIVVAEYSLNPKVFVYQYPQKKLIKTLENVSDLQINQMDLSFDAKRLLVVTGVPKYEINIFDLETGLRMHGHNSSVPLRNDFIKAQFSPAKESSFGLLYSNCFVLCEIFPCFEVDETGEEISQNIRIDKKNLISENSKFTNFIWDEQNNIYLADGFDLKYLNGTDLTQILNKEFDFQPEFLLLTQKHLIVVLQNGRFEWIYKYDPINLHEEDVKPFKLDKTYFFDQEKIIQIIYNHSYSKMYAGSDEGSIITFPVEGETFDIEEEEEQQDKENEAPSENEDESREIDIQIEKKGPFPVSPIIFIRELEHSNVAITITEDGRIFFWDIEKKTQISTLKLNCEINCADLHQNDQTLILGSKQGVVRILDISNLTAVEVVKHIKIFEKKPISFVSFNPDYSMFYVGSKSSKKLYFVNATKHNVFGYASLPAQLQGLTWNSSLKLVISTTKNVVFVLLNYFLLTLIVPDATHVSEQLLFSPDLCPIYGRKIDPDLDQLIVNPATGDLICTGKDKILKRYKQPEELFAKMDTRIKVGGAPIEEQDGHPLPTNVMLLSDNFNLLVSGGQDGSIYLRNLEKLSEFQVIKAHNWKSNGVSSLDFSKKHKLLYTGGFDGSFFLWNLDKISFAGSPSVTYEVLKEGNIDTQDTPDDKILHFQKVLEEEFIKSQKETRELQKQEILKALEQIKSNLRKHLRDNENAEEMEKLERDDFVIDLETKNKILEAGRQSREQLRLNAKRENYKQEILNAKIKEKTWDEMSIQLKGINGLKANVLINNFHIRQRTAEEERKLKLIKNLRRMEIREQRMRKENNLSEVIQIEDLMKNPSEYIINAVPGKQKMVLIDYEKKEELKEDGKGKAGAAGAAAAGGASSVAGAGLGGRARHGAQAKKEEKKVEEVHVEEHEKKEVEVQEEEKKDDEELGDWDFLYGATELFTNNRKRNQIILLQAIIFHIKQEFNKEFDKMMQQRQVQVDIISEKNKRIEEILGEIRKTEDIFQVKKNLLENPERVLDVHNSEIPFKKYLTREERDRIEKERLKEEERIRALLADDANIRAIKDMMNGTIEEKKENPLEQGLEVEEWMSKPAEEMNEEERVRLKEYEVKKQRLEEEKEKIRKNLENELKKIKSDVLEICNKYDDKLLLLFKRKLEFDYRVFEQELGIVRLAQSILSQNDTLQKKTEFTNTITQLSEKYELAKQHHEKLELFRQEVENQNKKLQESFQQALNVKPAYGVDPNKIKNIWIYAFEDARKDERKKKDLEDKIMNDQKYKNELIKLDPLIELNKTEIKKKLESIFESYIDDIKEKIANMQMFDKNEEQGVEFIKNVLHQRFQYKKDLDLSEIELRDITNSIQNFEQETYDLENKLQECIEDERMVSEHLLKCKSNIEMIVRFKQGFVEIPQDKPVPSLTDAVLIPRDAIEKRNEEIEAEGKKKIQVMEDIKNIKFAVAEAEYDLKKRDLNEQKVRCSTREVQLLRVKKEMQVALTKKDMRLNEYAFKNLQDQIDMLKQATEKRVNIYEKKCKKIDEQIEFIRRENEQLRAQGVSLRNTVQQEEKFSATMSKKNQQQQQPIAAGPDDKTDYEAFDKFKQISINRMLFTKVKRQTEEIELLREELGKLKARTFANFTSVQR